ncbi:hypothetical protein KIN20_035415 [Parelaphostrongylus tenuis]|uniref:Uncharacterized protein n=1 Tax=Parelaphostrongylus tenuis TaxID=148309 RepID=A0AAD5WKH8_PARTN|nr:hypothetical protein KIN20_035415 [Parelaphostrongylus tenuis]
MAIFRAKSSDSLLSSSPVQTLTAVRYIFRISAFLVCEGWEERPILRANFATDEGEKCYDGSSRAAAIMRQAESVLSRYESEESNDIILYFWPIIYNNF